MRTIWARRKPSPQPAVDRLHFVMWNFLRMFLAAIVCGMVVSAIVAGIALVLARDAYAAAGCQGYVSASTTGSPSQGTIFGTNSPVPQPLNANARFQLAGSM